MSVCGGGFGCVGVVGSINDAADTCLSGCFTSLSIYLPPPLPPHNVLMYPQLEED